MNHRTPAARCSALRSGKAAKALLIILALVGAVVIYRYGFSFARRVSLAELERATKDQPFINYCGTEGNDHRFETQAGVVFLVSRDELKDLEKPLFSFPRSGEGVRLFVTIRDGKVQVSDARKAADWLKRQEPGDSGPDQQAEPAIAAPALNKELPVVRHDTSPEPKLLVVSSAGEWTDADLARLDEVLKTWIETECPERKNLAEQDPEDRPWLRSDPAKSSPDRITVAIQAENFKSIWCESLGRRLVQEFPFLWQLETGEMLGSASPVEWDDTFISVPRKTISLDGGSKTTVEPFEIARYPVSFEQFLAFATATGHVTTAEKQGSEKTFRNPTGTGEPVPRADRKLPVSHLSYQDATDYCQWAKVRLPTDTEYLAAMILDDRIFPRGDKDASQLQEELFLSPQALRGDWLNFTSTEAKAGIVCRYGPPMLRFEGMRLRDPPSRIVVGVDSYKEGVVPRVCKLRVDAK
jgi:hypothetical protein